jgi:hypothetical protein
VEKLNCTWREGQSRSDESICSFFNQNPVIRTWGNSSKASTMVMARDSFSEAARNPQEHLCICFDEHLSRKSSPLQFVSSSSAVRNLSQDLGSPGFYICNLLIMTLSHTLHVLHFEMAEDVSLTSRSPRIRTKQSKRGHPGPDQSGFAPLSTPPHHTTQIQRPCKNNLQKSHFLSSAKLQLSALDDLLAEIINHYHSTFELPQIIL